MPILFNNSSDTSDKSVPPLVVGTPREIVLSRGESVNIMRDGILISRLSKPQDRYLAVALGTYTFTIPDSCRRPTIIESSELADQSISLLVDIENAIGSSSVSSTTTLCNEDGEWTVLNIFDVDDVSTPTSTVFINPLGVVAADPTDLAPCAVDSGSSITVVQDGVMLDEGSPSDIFGSLSVTLVRRWFVGNTSGGDLTIEFASGRTITLTSGGSYSSGDSDSNKLVDVTGIRIQIQDEPVQLSWEI